MHVTLRVVDGVRLRKEGVLEEVRAAIEAGGRSETFRVVEFNVLGNHVHMIVEAGGHEALARGMQGLAVRFARRSGARSCIEGGGPVLERAVVRGWGQPIRTNVPWIKRLLKRERPTARAKTWLLAEGWRKHGPLDVDEVPG